MNTKKQRVLSCDVDGIFNTYPKCWLEYLAAESGKTFSTVAEAKSNLPEYRQYKDNYRRSDFKANLPMIEGAKGLVNKLHSEGFKVIITTSRPINDAKYPDLYRITKEWLQKNGVTFDEFLFKDKNAEWVKECPEIEFHIDDDPEYARLISKKGIQVYLLRNDNWDFTNIDNTGGISVIDNLEEIIEALRNKQNEAPLFSVCIPVTNRERTIYGTLESVARQTYRNFEVIIAECGSSDRSREEIERFFASDIFKENSFEYQYLKNDWAPKTVEDWNLPIKMSKGKYVAMLEGDDQFLPEHLFHAAKTFAQYENLGVYADGNQYQSRANIGLIPSKEWLFSALRYKDPAPPSEAIFIRKNREGLVYLYDEITYEYSPEIDLYIRIAADGFDLYNADMHEVYRDKPQKKKIITWHYFVDRFAAIDKFKDFYDKKEIRKRRKEETVFTLKRATRSLSNMKDVSCRLIKRVGFFTYSSAIIECIVGKLSK